MTRFKYYTIYRCKNCSEKIRVHGKLTSKLILPTGMQMCCHRPRLVRERQVLISDYKEKETDLDVQTRKKKGHQKSLAEYSKRTK